MTRLPIRSNHRNDHIERRNVDHVISVIGMPVRPTLDIIPLGHITSGVELLTPLESPHTLLAISSPFMSSSCCYNKHLGTLQIRQGESHSDFSAQVTLGASCHKIRLEDLAWNEDMQRREGGREGFRLECVEGRVFACDEILKGFYYMALIRVPKGWRCDVFSHVIVMVEDTTCPPTKPHMWTMTESTPSRVACTFAWVRHLRDWRSLPLSLFMGMAWRTCLYRQTWTLSTNMSNSHVDVALLNE